MDKNLKKGLTALISRLESTEKFVLEQAPEICKQLIEEKKIRETSDAILYGVFTTFCLITSIALAVIYFQQPMGKYGPSDVRFITGILSILAVVGFFPSFGMTYESLRNLFLLKKCPKLYLLRSFRGMLE